MLTLAKNQPRISLNPSTPKELYYFASLSRVSDYEQYFRRFPQFTQTIAECLVNHYTISDETNKILGVMCLANPDNLNRKIEFGALILRDIDNREFVLVESTLELLSYIFNYLGYNKAYTLMLEEREHTHAKLEGYGFLREAVLRDNCYWKGKYWNEVMHSLTKEEFDTLFGGRN